VELEIEGELALPEATGDGAVDAAFNAVRVLVPHEVQLSHFNVQAVTEGCDAQARASVRLDADGLIVDGQGADTDTVVAAVRAYLHALNKLAAQKRRDTPLRATG
jgi:2-isopropylmalate synthase